MNRKIFFLFTALLLPGLIYLFLRTFGKNEFDIPIRYQTSADSLNSICHTNYRSPYTLSDSVLRSLHWRKTGATVFIFSRQDNKELNRLPDTFSQNEFEVINVPSQMTDSVMYGQMRGCVFFINDPWDIVLLDSQKRIRGYYQGAMREEMDRLILEMKILLKKY